MAKIIAVLSIITDLDLKTDKTPMYKGFAVFLETVKTDRRLTANRP